MRGWLCASLMAGLAACQGAPSEDVSLVPDFAVLNWLDPAADPVVHLTAQPATCLTAPRDPVVIRGALLFESPLLLGGQAAKAGLSCAACHRNGRGNPEFLFAGISGAPGTADVTHGLFSSARADQVFNPVPIPDLATRDGQSRVDRNRSGELERFLAAQIVEEFSGSVPSSSAIDDLAAYIRALDDRACDSDQSEPQSWTQELDRIRVALSTSPSLLPDYRNAMRAALGRLHARFPAAEHADLRAKLIAISRAVQTGATEQMLETDLAILEDMLARADASSLYQPDRLASARR